MASTWPTEPLSQLLLADSSVILCSPFQRAGFSVREAVEIYLMPHRKLGSEKAEPQVSCLWAWYVPTIWGYPRQTASAGSFLACCIQWKTTFLGNCRRSQCMLSRGHKESGSWKGSFRWWWGGKTHSNPQAPSHGESCVQVWWTRECVAVIYWTVNPHPQLCT